MYYHPGFAQYDQRTSVTSAGTLLIVDDEPDILDLLTKFLSGSGYTVLTATDGEQALGIAHRTALNLILMDRMLPHLDGVTTSRRLRADPYTADIPLVLMSATCPDDVSLFCDFIAKPFVLDVLLTCVRRYQRSISAAGGEEGLIRRYY